MWYLILCVSLTRLRNAQIVSKGLFLNVYVKVFLEEISIWIGKLSKGDGLLQWGWNPVQWWPKENQKLEERLFAVSTWAEIHFLPPSDSLGLLALKLPASNQHLYRPSALPWPASNSVYTSDWDWIMPPAFLVLQTQNMGLTGLHNNMSQFLW